MISAGRIFPAALTEGRTEGTEKIPNPVPAGNKGRLTRQPLRSLAPLRLRVRLFAFSRARAKTFHARAQRSRRAQRRKQIQAWFLAQRRSGAKGENRSKEIISRRDAGALRPKKQSGSAFSNHCATRKHFWGRLLVRIRPVTGRLLVCFSPLAAGFAGPESALGIALCSSGTDFAAAFPNLHF
jgi:hypothetical protein